VIRNKFFLFGSFDILRRLTAQNSTAVVETPEFANYIIQSFPNNKSAYLLKHYPAAMAPFRDFRTVGTMLDDQGISRAGLLSSTNCSGLATMSTLVTTNIGCCPAT